ncbi:MAG: SAM-dependent methyltransferase [Thermoplasmata archaeon]|nr:MAG: SAM-dependent methyltransferase [Thermoplasmata archaeon]
MKLGEIEKELEKVVELIRKGYQRDFIKEEISGVYFGKDKIFEIAKCRIKAEKKFGKIAEKLFFDEEGLRYATPPEIADYRAKRLNGNVIADICCGVGLQLIYFSKYSKKAIGVEMDRTRAKLAKLNLLAMNIENVEIIEGDALKIFSKIDADCIFCDPSRQPEEKERKFETLTPNPLKVYEIYRKKTDKIAFELPPQIRKEKIKIEGEKEYTSLNFDLNRLALYTGSLATCDTSAISLPIGERITNEDEKIEIKKSEKLHDFLYEVDRTIIKAGLLENFAGKIGFEGNLLQVEERRTLLTSPLLYDSAFLRPC